VIELSDEMREAFQRAAGWPGPPWRFGADVANGLTAVLAIVARDMVPPGPCSAELPPFVGDVPSWCQLRHGHAGDHENETTRWREGPS
jgi:hypothetical protein